MKKAIIGFSILIAAILLTPMHCKLKDGGSVIYDALIYDVRINHSIADEYEDADGDGYFEGISVTIFGVTIFDNIK